MPFASWGTGVAGVALSDAAEASRVAAGVVGSAGAGCASLAEGLGSPDEDGCVARSVLARTVGAGCTPRLNRSLPPRKARTTAKARRARRLTQSSKIQSCISADRITARLSQVSGRGARRSAQIWQVSNEVSAKAQGFDSTTLKNRCTHLAFCKCCI